MCGIAGIISYQNNLNIRQWLHSASEILSHRGNDDEGYCLFSSQNIYCSKLKHSLFSHSHLKYLQHINSENIPNEKFFIGLLHRRLSIIDLSEYGHQPMCDETGKVWITYNGEIYNYPELRQTLQKKGFNFYSNTDTEVVLKAYLQYGKAFAEYMDGMWALCILDLRNNEIVLSRDRLGVKPLYYYHSKNIFAFASEQKVFLKTNLLPLNINNIAASKYLTDKILEDTEENFIKDIYELKPGTNLFVSLGNIEIRKEEYFHLNNLLSAHLISNEKNIIEKTKDVISNSIYAHLRSDVEVAVSLSGGIDSSIIAIQTGRYLKNTHTFSVIYPDCPDIDESKFINEVNKKINSTNHFIIPSAEKFFEDIDELLYSQDIPIWSTSTYNQFLLMKEVQKNGIKVILSGQGSDELFAGYHHHYVAYWFSLLKRWNWLQFFQHAEKSKKIVPHPYLLIIKSIIKNYYNYNKKVAQKFLSDEIISLYKNNQEHCIDNELNAELLKDLSYRRLKAFLKCEDRCSMWHSVESRLPFSDDINTLQWAFQIPDNIKLKNGINKYVLREAFKDELPEKIYYRKDKKGFDAPLKEWLIPLQGEIIHEIREYCKDETNIKNLNKIKSIHHLSNAETEMLFRLFLLSRWKRVWKV